MKYVTAKNLELRLSETPSKWIGGRVGAETLVGSSGNDGFYDSGPDRLYGGAGDDTYVTWDKGSQAIENAGEGVDTLDFRGWGPVVLAQNVENLILKSPGATSGTGNAANNIIMAGAIGATLDGRGGDDVLVGGERADLFRVTAGNGSDAIVNFKPGSDVVKLEGYGISTFDQLKAAASQDGADLVFNFSNGESLILRDTGLADVSAYDFGLKQESQPLPPGYESLVGPGQVHSDFGWYVLNNVWNPGPLTYGSDYTVRSAYDPKDVSSGVTFEWSFPVVTDAFPTIRAYPEIIFGPAPTAGGLKATDTAGVFPIRIGDITSLTAHYDVGYRGNTDGFNVAFDMWLTDKPNGGQSSITSEVMIWVHQGGFPPFGTLVGTYVEGSISAKIYQSDLGDWTYTAVILDEDVPKGDLEVGKILQKLNSLGIIKDSEYLASVELGAEVASGAGTLTINNLDLTVKTTVEGLTKTYDVTGSGTTVTTSVLSTDMPGDDRIVYDPSASVINGGAGSDTLVLTGPATVKLANVSSSQVEGGKAFVAGFEHVDASAATGPVVLTGSQYANTLTGSAHADTLSGGGGADTLSGGRGNDFIDGGEGQDRLEGGDGDDRLVYDASDSLIAGGSGSNTLVLKGAAAVKLGNFSSSQVESGKAYVTGFHHADASAATGPVVLTGSQYANTLTGSAHADTLSGGGGTDILSGGRGNDLLDGGADTDRLEGGDGDDRIVYDASDFLIAGGSGSDTLLLTGAASVKLGNFSSNQVEGGKAFVEGFEHVDASAATGPVVLTGSQYANSLTGSAYADTLSGGGGADTLSGGRGNDLLDGGEGQDRLEGGDGDDRIVYDASDFLIAGGSGSNTLVLTGAATVKLGNFSSSQVEGARAYVTGFQHADASAATGPVVLTGSQYANTLTGSAHADTLSGGGGWDTFVFRTSLGAENVDKIQDFNVQQDVIALDDAIFAGLNTAWLHPNSLHIGVSAVDQDDRILYDKATGALSYDRDGSGHQYGAVQFASISPDLALTHANFFVV